MLLSHTFYTTDFGTNSPGNAVSVATTVTEVSDHVAAAVLPTSTVAPVPTMNVPTSTVRQAQKRMVAGIRVSGKHGEYAAIQVDGTAKKRQIKT